MVEKIDPFTADWPSEPEFMVDSPILKELGFDDNGKFNITS